MRRIAWKHFQMRQPPGTDSGADMTIDMALTEMRLPDALSDCVGRA